VVREIMVSRAEDRARNQASREVVERAKRGEFLTAIHME
jgi:hypothetical protein